MEPGRFVTPDAMSVQLRHNGLLEPQSCASTPRLKRKGVGPDSCAISRPTDDREDPESGELAASTIPFCGAAPVDLSARASMAEKLR